VCADCPDCVAVIVGTSQVGLYSPDGNCQYSLAPLPPSPIGMGFLTMALMNKQILVEEPTIQIVSSLMLQETNGAFIQQDILPTMKEEVLFTREKSICLMTLILKSLIQ
jgi:hypothetical protein